MGRDGQRGAQRDRVSPCAGLGRDDEDDGSDGDDDEEERSRAGGNAEGEAEMERAREIRTSTVDVGIDENIGCGTQKRPVDLSRVWEGGCWW